MTTHDHTGPRYVLCAKVCKVPSLSEKRVSIGQILNHLKEIFKNYQNFSTRFQNLSKYFSKIVQKQKLAGSTSHNLISNTGNL